MMRSAILALAVLSLSHAGEAARLVVEPYPLSAVRLLESPFKQNMDRCRAYLLRLEPDRLLAGFRSEAGLEPSGERYGGWERDTVAGHSLGHYLSAVSLAYAATGDAQFRECADYIVAELAACQDAHGDGYVGAIPEGRVAFERLRAGEVAAEPFNLNGIWVPWYTQHKVLAGLLDAHAHAGNARALEVAAAFARYAEAVTANLTDAQWQTMLSCEHGGINESLAELYARTGEERFLALSRGFHHRAVLGPLAEGTDCLPGLHANTQIPKIIGVALRHELTGDPEDRAVADFFWERVARHHSYVTGGHSLDEHFGPPDSLAARLGPRTMETCNTYNMLKLTRRLFCLDAKPERADFYERALYNHILASQNPADGMTCYYVPLEPGQHKTYSTPFESFWCCTGTGLENHVRYGEAVYFHTDDALYVNLFIPSELTWAERGVTLRQETDYPESGVVMFRFSGFDEAAFSLCLRVPGWVNGTPEAEVNGEPVDAAAHAGGYLAIQRAWKAGDTVTLRLPMALRLESMPDDPRRVAVFHGPVVLAADLGPANGEESGIPGPEPLPDGPGEPPTLLMAGRPVEAWLKPAEGESLAFRTHGTALPEELTLLPFYRMHHRRYTVFLDLLTRDEWDAREEARRETARRRAVLDTRTVDTVAIGDEESEKAHNLRGENSRTGHHLGRNWRDAADGGWFSYDLAGGSGDGLALLVTYWGSDAGARSFDIVVNGTGIARETLQRPLSDQFLDKTYPLPAEVMREDGRLTVRFDAHPGNMAGGVFGLRLVRPASRRCRDD